MGEYLKKVWAQVQEATKGLAMSKKIAIGAVAIITMLGILGVAYMSNTPEYSVLFSGLTQGDAAAITQNLSSNKVPYKLESNGTAIMVPSDKVHELRLSLATAGLPAGGSVGFEIFDKSSFGMTDFVQKINFKRALQGELERTISDFHEIQSCRVHIAIPEKKLFSKEQNNVTASVVVKLKGGRSLKKDQVAGVVHLVASSIEGLKPENVTVVDVDGHVLSGGEQSDDVARLSSTQLEYRTSVERDMEKRISSMIENVVGQGKVVTRVSADVDFRRIERTEKKYDPDSQVARSEQRNESKSTGAQPPAGVPGVQSNVPEGEGQSQTSGSAAASSQNQETINYEINEVVSHMVEPVGTIKKLSVAVIVDGKYVAKKGDTAGAKEYQPRSDQEVKQLNDLVKTAVGFDANRGDQITVSSAPFDTSKLTGDIEDAQVESSRQLYMQIIQYLGMAALVIALFVFGMRPLLRWITASSKEIDALRAFPQTVKEVEEQMGLKGEEEEVDYRTKVKVLISENPKFAAEMLRAWLKARR